MSDQLSYIREAIAKGEKKVSVVRTRTNKQSGIVEKDATISVNAETALRYLSMPYNERPFAYKKIQPLNFAHGLNTQSGPEKNDYNPLSLENLKEAALSNPEVIKAILEAEKAKKKAEKEAKTPTESPE